LAAVGVVVVVLVLGRRRRDCPAERKSLRVDFVDRDRDPNEQTIEKSKKKKATKAIFVV
jgi:hypothetical protein